MRMTTQLAHIGPDQVWDQDVLDTFDGHPVTDGNGRQIGVVVGSAQMVDGWLTATVDIEVPDALVSNFYSGLSLGEPR